MQSKYVDFIQVPEIKDFTREALEKFSDSDLLIEGESVANVLIALLKKKQIIADNSHQSFVDILVSAALLHNIFYDPDDWKTLFLARQSLKDLAEKHNLGYNYYSALFQTIESQLGQDTPVPNCKPIDNSPTELFSYAVWFVKEYDPQSVL